MSIHQFEYFWLEINNTHYNSIITLLSLYLYLYDALSCPLSCHYRDWRESKQILPRLQTRNSRLGEIFPHIGNGSKTGKTCLRWELTEGVTAKNENVTKYSWDIENKYISRDYEGLIFKPSNIARGQIHYFEQHTQQFVEETAYDFERVAFLQCFDLRLCLFWIGFVEYMQLCRNIFLSSKETWSHDRTRDRVKRNVPNNETKIRSMRRCFKQWDDIQSKKRYFNQRNDISIKETMF